jgi:hypothetical protein
MSLDGTQCTVPHPPHGLNVARCALCGEAVCQFHWQRRFPLAGIFCSVTCMDRLAEQIIAQRPVDFKFAARVRRAILLHSLPGWNDPRGQIDRVALLSTTVLVIHIARGSVARLVYDPSVWVPNPDFASTYRADFPLGGWKGLDLAQIEIPFFGGDSFERVLKRGWQILSYRQRSTAKWFRSQEHLRPEMFKPVGSANGAAAKLPDQRRVIRLKASK